MNVVFDVGNVLLRWDPRHLYRKLFDDAERMEWFLAHVCDPAWNLEQDRGRSFADAVAERIARHPEWEAQIRAYDERWIETLDGIVEENAVLLRRLKKEDVPLYAITNFSAEKFAVARAHFPVFDVFDGIVVSGEEKLLKPEPAIYRLLLDRYGLAAADCVFIDDSAANVDGARAIGMHGILYAPGVDLAARLAEMGVLPEPMPASASP